MTDEHREAFEKWVASRHASSLRFAFDDTDNYPGHYKNYSVQLAWEAWQESGRTKKPRATGFSPRRSKYGLRSMKVGDVRHIAGGRAYLVQQACSSMKRRNPELRDRQYLWWNIDGGVRIERVG